MGKRKRSIYQTKPTRLWFLARDYKQADTRYTKGRVVWLHPQTNDVLGEYGQNLSLQLVPSERQCKKHPRYLKLRPQDGDKLLARLKYLTFKGKIKPGHTIDHIDGNTFNNDIRNLRAVTPAINFRDGGFMRKLRHNGYNVADFPGIILEGYERMARWKAEHTPWQYQQLKGQDLLRVFVGPTFNVVDPDIVMDLDFKYHREL